MIHEKKGDNMSIDRKCGCGKSPTGFCIGWHSLNQKEYEEKLKEFLKNKDGTNTLPQKPQ